MNVSFYDMITFMFVFVWVIVLGFHIISNSFFKLSKEFDLSWLFNSKKHLSDLQVEGSKFVIFLPKHHILSSDHIFVPDKMLSFFYPFHFLCLMLNKKCEGRWYIYIYMYVEHVAERRLWHGILFLTFSRCWHCWGLLYQY